MSFNGRKKTQKLLTINEMPDFEQASIGSTPLLKNSPLLYEPPQPTQTQVVPNDDSYAFTETQHSHLLGDVAAQQKLALSSINWKESLRKQYNSQKYVKFRAPYQLSKTYRFFQQFREKYKQWMPIIDPQSNFITYWKMPVLFITVLIFIEIPLIIFFGDDFYVTFKDPMYTFFRSFAIVIFIMDIFVEFHVAFYRHGALVKNRKRVASNYLGGMFFFDFLPVMELIISSFSYYLANEYFFHLLFMLKLYPVYQIDQRFLAQLQIHAKSKSAYMILRMVVEIIYLTHFFGCIFFGTGMYMLNRQERTGILTNSWLTYQGNFGLIQEYDWPKRYVLSTYWAFATLTTVAYGDITPMNEFEIIVSEIAMVAAVFLVAMNVAGINHTFAEYFEDRRKYQKEIIAITKFMRQKQVCPETEKEIKNFLEHYFKEKINRDQYLEDLVIAKLAPQLKSKLFYEAYQKYLYSVSWIKNNFTVEFIKEMSQLVEEVDYSTKENVFLDNAFQNQDDNSLYFVQIGHIEIFIDVPETKRHEVVIAHLKCGAHFGDYGFISGMGRQASARSKKYSQVVRITRTRFMEKLKLYPMDHQRFCYLRDEVVFNQAYYELGLQCYTCQSTDHMSIDCSLTHLNIGRDTISQARKALVERKNQELNNSPFQERARAKRIDFKYRSRIQVIHQDLLDEHFKIIEEKTKFEAFFTDNCVIIESFQVDKIENFVCYYPDHNFDLRISKKRLLNFATEIRQRNVSISRKSEILM